ncbi:MAG TPA: methyltransferase domain-containing protein [Candidatus Acidoferrales bacterium]|nr:methyltransferase domain-containing protein [Candidatus Acidoferrales bacterium]
MKVSDSGMPDETYWNSLFHIPGIVEWLDIKNAAGPIVEIGCGYGSFTVTVAKETGSEVYSFDIDPQMLAAARNNAERAALTNVHFFLRDVLEEGTGLDSAGSGMVLLFNILHFNERRVLLQEASRILKPSGVAAIIHWRKDIETPRGPRIETRPDKEMILASIGGLDLHFNGDSRILEPYHWGIKLIKEIKRRS